MTLSIILGLLAVFIIAFNWQDNKREKERNIVTNKWIKDIGATSIDKNHLLNKNAEIVATFKFVTTFKFGRCYSVITFTDAIQTAPNTLHNSIFTRADLDSLVCGSDMRDTN